MAAATRGLVMSIESQIDQIRALRDKAVSARDRAAALVEKHAQEAAEFETAIAVLVKISPPREDRINLSQRIAAAEAPVSHGPIWKRILDAMNASEKVWWTANELQDALSAGGDVVKMTSISPNLSRLKDGGDIVRDDLKVALADRAPQKAEAPEDDLLSGNSSGASNDHDLTNRGTQPSSLVKPWAGGGT